MNHRHQHTRTFRGESARRRLSVALAALLLVAAGAPTALAQTCIGQATGVPAAGGPPVWWQGNTPPTQPVYAQNLDDPRWTGSSSINYAGGMGPGAIFRLGHDTTHLYLSWQIRVAPAATPEDNFLFFGHEPAGGGNPTIVMVRLKGLAPAAATTPSITTFEHRAFSRDPGTGAEVIPALPNPAWFNETRVWINNPIANSYAVQMRVPMSALAVDGSGNFKLWFNAFGGAPPPVMGGGMPPLFTFWWPRDNMNAIVKDDLGERIYPATTEWGTFKLNTMGCAPQGVSIGYYDIGTHNPTSSDIKFNPDPNAAQPVNEFYARPTNNTGSTVNAGQVLATWRIANWGSLPGWEDGVPVNTLWAPINNVPEPTNGNIPNTQTATEPQEADFNWQASPADVIAFNNGTRRKHQCMLVELTSGAGLQFSNYSVYRNMDFVETASPFTRTGNEISILGLPAFSPAGRDVYIYVSTANMPPSYGGRGPGTTHTASAVGQGGVVDLKLPSPQEITRSLADRRMTIDDVERTMPTYRVHVYHDTGRKLTVGGVERPLLRSQTSFGYYVSHTGQVTGWEHSIVGEDAVLEEIAPNFYRVRNVPNNGKFHVTTTIKPLEPGGGGPDPIDPDPRPPGDPSRYSIGLRAGVAIPHGTFGNIFDPGFSFNGDVEYDVTSNFSIQAIFGYHRFKEEFFGGHLDSYQLSANGKVYGGSPGASVRPFINFGGGVYHFRPSQTNGGVNIGGGLQFNVTPRFAFEGAYNFHNAFTPGFNARFSTVQGGVRFRF